MRLKYLSFALLAVFLGAGLGLWLYLKETPAPKTSPEPVALKAQPIKATRRASIQGIVLDDLGQPIAGATVSAGEEQQRTTDAQGRFAFEGLEPGSYLLDASAPGFSAPGPKELRARKVEVEGPAAPALKDVELVLRRPAQLTVKVLAGGAPQANAELGLYYLFAQGFDGDLEPFALDAVATTDAQGQAILTGVAPGRLRVLASASGLATADSRELRVSPGGEYSVEVDLAPSGGAIFQVNAENRPLPGAEVIVKGAQLPRDMRLVTDAYGFARFDGIVPGSIIATVNARGYRQVNERVEISAKGKPEVYTISLVQVKGLTGKVIFPEALPSAQAHVSVYQGDKVIHSAYIPESGEFIWEGAPTEPLYVQAVSPFFSQSQRLLVQAGQEFELKLGPGASISGKVVDSSGQPIQSYELVVDDMVPAQDKRFGRGSYQGGADRKRSSASGSFELGPLAPGTYFLRARPAQGFADVTSGAIEVREGAQVTGVVLKAQRGGKVYGTVTDSATGQPIAHASVDIFEPISALQRRQATTDEQGRYTIEGVSPGRFSVRVSRHQYSTEVAAGVELREGGQAQRDVKLSASEPNVRLSFFGIGAELAQTDRGVSIQRVLDGMPAQTFGLKQGDLILGIDGDDAQSLHINEVIEKIRGEEGAPVTLEVEREGEGRITLEVERGRVKVKY